MGPGRDFVVLAAKTIFSIQYKNQPVNQPNRPDFLTFKLQTKFCEKIAAVQ